MNEDVVTDVTEAVSDIVTTTTATSAAVQIDISDHVSVYSGVIPAEVVSVARDLVAGSTDDYFLGDLDSDSYFLIISRGGIDDTLHCDDCTAYQLDFVQSDSGARSVFLTVHEYESMEISDGLSLLAYSSENNFPKLIQGGSMYDYAQTFLLVLFLVLWGVDCIFSHIGHRG